MAGLGSTPAPSGTRRWEPGALTLAAAIATALLIVRLIFDSTVAEAVAVSLLAGVIVYGLAYLANERRPAGG